MANTCKTAHLDLVEARDRLGPTERLLDALALLLADRIARVPRRATVDGRSLHPLRHMRRHALLSQVGDKVALTVPIVQAGRYILRFTAAQTPASGKFSAFLDGESLFAEGEPVDLFVPYRTLLRTFSSKHVELNQGTHQITLRYEGGPAEVAKPEIGLDFLWVQKQ